MAVRVTKVGGSLFGFDALPDTVGMWLDLQPPATTFLIGGGGELIQPLRVVHERFRLAEDVSHWLAVRAMTVTSRLLAKLLDVELIESFEVVEQLSRTTRGGSYVLDVEEFLSSRETQLPGCRLPQNWSCTSDSIAARVAEVLQADELVLLKSVSLPRQMTIDTASGLGLVDEHFPVATTGLKRLRWVNLRSTGFDERIFVAANPGEPLS